MKTEHTPKPWSYGEDNDGWYVEKDGLQIAHGLSEEDARRIVACVNACEDILDYELSLGCVARLSEQLRTITKQRDELLAALERSLESFEYIAKYGNSCGHSQLRIPDLKAVIASVKGGAA